LTPVPPEPAPQATSWADSVSLDSIPLGPPPPPSAPATRNIPLRGESGETVYHTSAVYGGRHKHAQPPKRRPVAVMVTGGVVVVVVVALVLVLTVFKPGNGAPKYGLVPNGGSAQADAQQVATTFLTAWQTGNLAQAANYTDQPAAAQAGLAAYAKDLNLGKFTATASSVANAAGSTAAQPRQTVTFAVRASVATSGAKGAPRATWSYHSTLVAYQQAKSSVWFVAWQPDVVAPNLTTATHLAAILVPPTVSMVTDADGQNLKRYNDPGLDTIAGLLAASPPTNEGANSGLDVQIENKNGSPVANSQAPLIAPGNYPTLSTTINPKAETAAKTSVAMHSGSSMVVIQPSTGQILAIANNAGFNDFALTAAVAPGSTMKIITSTALLNSGLATANTGVACPAALTVQGITYHNDQGESEPAGTPLAYDFAQSCNNAFSQWWPQLSGKLASTAKDYYGLDQKWDIGISGRSASYFNAPASASGSELAQEAFGEGKLVASPLAMASVAATVDTGTFKQPILTMTAKQVTATALPAATDAGLKQMMREVVTQGTAAGLGFGPTVYAKTGTADIVGQEQPNSWLVAFDPTKDVAVACLVVNAGYGAQFAGPEAAAFLNAY
jgi:Penicillin binding protein transpeptidase domain/NTF2-like N-terminal transpeptidase domain